MKTLTGLKNIAASAFVLYAFFAGFNLSNWERLQADSKKFLVERNKKVFISAAGSSVYSTLLENSNPFDNSKKKFIVTCFDDKIVIHVYGVCNESRVAKYGHHFESKLLNVIPMPPISTELQLLSNRAPPFFVV